MKEEICALRIYIYEHCHEEMKEEMLEKYISYGEIVTEPSM